MFSFREWKMPAYRRCRSDDVGAVNGRRIPRIQSKTGPGFPVCKRSNFRRVEDLGLVQELVEPLDTLAVVLLNGESRAADAWQRAIHG